MGVAVGRYVCNNGCLSCEKGLRMSLYDGMER